MAFIYAITFAENFSQFVRRDVASLSLLLYFGKFNSAIRESDSKSFQEFLENVRHITSILNTHAKKRSKSFFVRTSQLCNQLPSLCFQTQYDSLFLKARHFVFEVRVIFCFLSCSATFFNAQIVINQQSFTIFMAQAVHGFKTFVKILSYR